ncbi:Helix-turn-helix domain-containing protein [Armatimonadetes bacterium DC]|nr:Helix-turn-helix domain-containing protein [Armatimonadetes bacterium DC]
MKTIETLGQRLKTLRQEQGLPIDVLAYKARCSTRTLILVEQWNLPPRRRKTRERIAHALGVSYEALWGELEARGGASP